MQKNRFEDTCLAKDLTVDPDVLGLLLSNYHNNISLINIAL